MTDDTEGAEPLDHAEPTVLITGATSGVGRATALALAHRGARLVLACRSEQRTRPVLDELRGLSPHGDATFLPLDLGDFDSVRACADAFLASGRPLHVLVNNAGVAGVRGLTASGFELAFGVNHMGHFLLSRLLLPRLRESSPARVVTVSSESHYQADGIPWELVRRPTRSFTGMREYAVSKLANVLFTQELARPTRASAVTAAALHPGIVASDIWRRVPRPVRPLITWFMLSPEDGARTPVWCATASEPTTMSGGFFDRCAPRRPSAAATAELGAELWGRSEAWTNAWM